MKDLIIYFVVIALLFFFIYKLTQRNISKTGYRNKRDFRTRFLEKKKKQRKI